MQKTAKYIVISLLTPLYLSIPRSLIPALSLIKQTHTVAHVVGDLNEGTKGIKQTGNPFVAGALMLTIALFKCNCCGQHKSDC
jgi:hypothetical protein